MLSLNGQQVPARGSLLDTCRAAGVDVPALCADPRVPAGGHCRMCMVEVNGRAMAACSTAARDGLTVQTDTEPLRAYRQDLAELVLCESAPKGEGAAVLERCGATGERYARLDRAQVTDQSHAYLSVDLDACILCRLCVRACAEVQGQFVLAVEGRGHDARITWGEGQLSDTDCVSCGACAAVCPTTAITDRDRQRAPAEEAVVRSTCSYCGVGCQLDVHVADDRVTRIEGSAAAVNHGHLCVKGRFAHTFSRHPDRLTTPLLRKHGQLVPVSWEEALAVVAQEFGRLRGSLGLLSSSRCTNEENYLAQKWFRGGLGTNNVDCCARVCHAPTATGMRRVFGTGAATNSLADLEKADLFLVAGSNTTESHPVTGARLKQAVLAGARLIVIDPRATEVARLADLHLQLRPGTNVALLNSLAAVLVEEGLVDQAFVDTRTSEYSEYKNHILNYLPERMEPVTGVPAAKVRAAARLYAGAARPMQVHGLGMTEHYQGSEGVMLLCNLALLVGAIGREGVGVNPLRGQNNVQGAADMGCQPDAMTGYLSPFDPAVRLAVDAVWGRPPPDQPGLTLPRMYEAARSGQLKGMFILGEDVVQTDPDADRVVEALKSLEFLVVQELFLSETAGLAHLVLPAASFLEKDGTFTNGERRVQRVRAAISPPGEARPDWRILCDLMAATGWPQPFQHPSEIMDEIARVSPAFRGVSYDRLDGDGLQWPVPAPGHPGTPILHAETFPVGRATLARVDYLPSPALRDAGDAMLLITGRVLEHYNCGSMTRRGDNVKLVGADAVSLHPDDAARLGLAEGDPVRLTSAWGEARGVAEITREVAPGTLFMSFHFPESHTNRLTSDVLDRLADCPEYKLTPVQVARAE